MTSYIEFVEELYKRGIISKEVYEKILGKYEEGKLWFY